MDTRYNDIRLILVIDSILACIAIFLSYQLRFNFVVPSSEAVTFLYVIPFYLLIRITLFLIYKVNRGLIRFTSVSDAQRIFLAIATGSIVFIIANIFTAFTRQFHVIPYSVIIIDVFISSFFILGFRLFIRILYSQWSASGKPQKNVIIFGAGEAGSITKKSLERETSVYYNVLAFIDDDERLSQKKLENRNIYTGKNALVDAIIKYHPEIIIISILSLPKARRHEIAEICMQYNVRLLNIPHVSKWIHGELSFNQIKPVKIEDLLERETGQWYNQNVAKIVNDKTILVTGAAGSIGSELVIQLLSLRPQKIILLDQAESALYDFEQQLLVNNTEVSYTIVLGDVRSYERMHRLFEFYRPDIVFHAAA